MLVKLVFNLDTGEGTADLVGKGNKKPKNAVTFHLREQQKIRVFLWTMKKHPTWYLYN
jgi:hypothetical protein